MEKKQQQNTFNFDTHNWRSIMKYIIISILAAFVMITSANAAGNGPAYTALKKAGLSEQEIQVVLADQKKFDRSVRLQKLQRNDKVQMATGVGMIAGGAVGGISAVAATAGAGIFATSSALVGGVILGATAAGVTTYYIATGVKELTK